MPEPRTSQTVHQLRSELEARGVTIGEATVTIPRWPMLRLVGWFLTSIACGYHWTGSTSRERIGDAVRGLDAMGIKRFRILSFEDGTTQIWIRR